jgi:Uma2 family endonuclease
MASLPHARTVTYEEWIRMPEVQDAIEEVVNGEIRIMPPAKLAHALIVENLHLAIVSQIDRKLVLVLSSSFGLIIRTRPLTSRVPDVAVFEKATVQEKDGYIHSAPQLVAEILSAANTRRERAEKLADYAALGIPEVWVVAPEGRTVEVLYLENGNYSRADILGDGDSLKPRLFPHVQVDIAQIWPD